MNRCNNCGILNAAFDVSCFVKTHEYPKEMSNEFFELTMLMDKLETELRKGGYKIQTSEAGHE